MTDIIQTIGKDAKTVGVDIVDGIEKIGTVFTDIERLLSTGKQLAPQVKADIAELIQDAEPIATVLAPVIATSGENVAVDVAAIQPIIADVVKLVKDFIGFLPSLKTAIADLAADVK